MLKGWSDEFTYRIQIRKRLVSHIDGMNWSMANEILVRGETQLCRGAGS